MVGQYKNDEVILNKRNYSTEILIQEKWGKIKQFDKSCSAVEVSTISTSKNEDISKNE